jgi:hypothetical protein
MVEHKGCERDILIGRQFNSNSIKVLSDPHRYSGEIKPQGFKLFQALISEERNGVKK